MDALWRFGRLAALHLWLLGLHRLRLDVGFEMALGLGSVSLRQVGFPQTSWLGVEAREVWAPAWVVETSPRLESGADAASGRMA